MKDSTFVFIKIRLLNFSAIMFLLSIVALFVPAQQKKVDNSEQLKKEQNISVNRNKSKVNPNNQNESQTRSRWLIAPEIRRQIEQIPDYSVFDWIEFNAKPNGVIILRGDVTNADKKTAAEEFVKRVDGVKLVFNEIHEMPFSPRNERLRKAIYNEIYSGPLRHYQTAASNQIHIIVDRNRIKLEGMVESETDKRLAGAAARKVSKLMYVDNQLVIVDRQKQLY